MRCLFNLKFWQEFAISFHQTMKEIDWTDCKTPLSFRTRHFRHWRERS